MSLIPGLQSEAPSDPEAWDTELRRSLKVQHPMNPGGINPVTRQLTTSLSTLPCRRGSLFALPETPGNAHSASVIDGRDFKGSLSAHHYLRAVNSPFSQGNTISSL